MNKVSQARILPFRKTIFLSFFCFLIGFTCAFIVFFIKTPQPIIAVGPIREKDTSLPLISPLLAYNTPETVTTAPLKKKLAQEIDQALQNDSITNASVYYRDLQTGKWFGINQDEEYVPASLFKVPLLIATLKEAESDSHFLENKVVNNLDIDENTHETIKALHTIEKGKIYTIQELLQYMIEYSDNNATALLFAQLSKETLQRVFTDLDLPLPARGSQTDFVSVQNYSFLFRILYNASYLNHEMSEKALEILSKSDFSEGMRKGMIPNLVVANKFGEYFLEEEGEVKERQLHDCGIVYDKKHPYLLCIMTKGLSLENLETLVQTISKDTFDMVQMTNDSTSNSLQ